MNSKSTCWQCGRAGYELFCSHCGALRAPAADFFELFGIEQQLSLDAGELQRRFYELSRKLHPDLYVRKSEQERQNAVDASALLNDGYRTLRDPVKRAEYVLKRHGFDIGEQRSKDVPPELLEEVFELNMALEELKSGEESARPQLEAAKQNFGRMREEIDVELSTLFLKYDQAE